MLQTFQNFDRIWEILGSRGFITKSNRFIPRGYSAMVNFPSDLNVKQGITNLPISVSTKEGEVILEAATPGVHPQDIEIFAENNSLKISGKFPTKRKTEESNPEEEQISKPSFEATVALPSNVDASQAVPNYENGLLTIQIPRKSTEHGKRIEIQVKDNKKIK